MVEQYLGTGDADLLGHQNSLRVLLFCGDGIKHRVYSKGAQSCGEFKSAFDIDITYSENYVKSLLNE